MSGCRPIFSLLVSTKKFYSLQGAGGCQPHFFCLLWNKLNSPNNGCIENIWAQCTVKKKTFELAIILCNSGSGVQGAGEKLLFHLEKSCNDQSLRMTTYAEAREILHLHIHHLSDHSDTTNTIADGGSTATH